VSRPHFYALSAPRVSARICRQQGGTAALPGSRIRVPA
jgi:hypothetical protein